MPRKTSPVEADGNAAPRGRALDVRPLVPPRRKILLSFTPQLMVSQRQLTRRNIAAITLYHRPHGYAYEYECSDVPSGYARRPRAAGAGDRIGRVSGDCPDACVSADRTIGAATGQLAL